MLTQEEYEALPEKAKTAFALSGDEYIPAKDAKLKQTLDTLDKEFKSFKSTHEEAVTKAAEEARLNALAEAEKKGDSEEVKRLRQEQREDELQRAREEAKSEAEQEFNLRVAKKEADFQIEQIVNAMNPKSENAKRLLTLAIKQNQKIDENGNILYLNDDGSATSLTASAYSADAVKSGHYDDLIKPEFIVSGGSKLSGSNGGGASQKKFNDYTGAELSQLRKENPTEYDALKNEFNKGL